MVAEVDVALEGPVLREQLPNMVPGGIVTEPKLGISMARVGRSAEIAEAVGVVAIAAVLRSKPKIQP